MQLVISMKFKMMTVASDGSDKLDYSDRYLSDSSDQSDLSDITQLVKKKCPNISG
jgi:hypothetical protein